MFVTLEGPEGAGKSTLIRGLAAYLEQQGTQVFATREPGSGNVGASIRQILLHGDELDARAELFLFMADRAQHVAAEIRPALARGSWVICDRFADSTIVYQGYGRGLDLQMLRDLNHLATGGLQPEITLLLDIEPQLGLARIADKDRLDSEPLEFHIRIRNGFLAEAAMSPARWVILDASADPQVVLQRALEALAVGRAQEVP